MKHGTTILSDSSSKTAKLGKEMARKILKSPSQERAVVIGLVGELGGGKTTFLKGFAKGLGIKDKILSPTFIIIKKFKIPNTYYLTPFTCFYHIDCYRTERPKEILALGFKKIIADPKNIICVEWADKIKKILPKNVLIIKFKFAGKSKREILINNLT